MKQKIYFMLFIIIIFFNLKPIFSNDFIRNELNHLSKEKHEISVLEWKLLKFYVYTLSNITFEHTNFNEIRYDSSESKFKTDMYISETKGNLLKQGINLIDELKKYGLLIRDMLARDLGFEPLEFNNYLYIRFYILKQGNFIEFAKFDAGNLVIF